MKAESFFKVKCELCGTDQTPTAKISHCTKCGTEIVIEWGETATVFVDGTAAAKEAAAC